MSKTVTVNVYLASGDAENTICFLASGSVSPKGVLSLPYYGMKFDLKRATTIENYDNGYGYEMGWREVYYNIDEVTTTYLFRSWGFGSAVFVQVRGKH